MDFSRGELLIIEEAVEEFLIMLGRNGLDQRPTREVHKRLLFKLYGIVDDEED